MYPDKVQLLRFAVRLGSGPSCIIYALGQLSLESITSRGHLPNLYIFLGTSCIFHSDSNASSLPLGAYESLIYSGKVSVLPPLSCLLLLLFGNENTAVAEQVRCVLNYDQVINPWRNKTLFLSRKVVVCVSQYEDLHYLLKLVFSY